MNPIFEHMAGRGTSHTVAVNEQLNIIGSGGAEQSMNAYNDGSHGRLLSGECLAVSCKESNTEVHRAFGREAKWKVGCERLPHLVPPFFRRDRVGTHLFRSKPRAANSSSSCTIRHLPRSSAPSCNHFPPASRRSMRHPRRIRNVPLESGWGSHWDCSSPCLFQSARVQSRSR
jgi:hypothetical protein